ncbi:hypothetical protein ElyMa_003189900 [Elysia marginata]|uniref:Uncharacterized protein n=1 Tax=Elysia marginata TaxID=1093978 RepID=A0AAV4J2L6_9GAST|nr:hypothetical protein ElyMa_003189900 [Elysia marginata]
MKRSCYSESLSPLLPSLACRGRPLVSSAEPGSQVRAGQLVTRRGPVPPQRAAQVESAPHTHRPGRRHGLASEVGVGGSRPVASSLDSRPGSTQEAGFLGWTPK